MLLDELTLESVDWRNLYDLDLSHHLPPSLASPSIPRTPSPPPLASFSSPVPDFTPRARPRRGIKRMLVKAPPLETLPEEGDDESPSPADGWSSDGSQTDSAGSEDEDEDDGRSSILPAIGLGLGSLSDLDLVDDDDDDVHSAADGQRRTHPSKAERDTDLLELMLDSLLLDSLLLEADYIPPRPPTALGRTSRSVKRRGLAHLAPLAIIKPSAFPLPPATSPSLSSRSGHSSILLRSPPPSAASTMRSPESDASWSSDDLAVRTPDVDQPVPQPTWDLSLTPWVLTPPPSAGPSSPSLGFPSSPGLCGTLSHQPRSPSSLTRPTSATGTLNRPATAATINRSSASPPSPNRPPQPSFTNRPKTLASRFAHPFATPPKGSFNRPSYTPPPPPVSISPPTPPRSFASSRASLAFRSSPPPRPSSSTSSSSSSSSSSRRTLPRRSALPAPFLAEIGQSIGHAV